jgi:hypothetical protein
MARESSDTNGANERTERQGQLAERRRQWQIEREANRPAVRPNLNNRTGIEEVDRDYRHNADECVCMYCTRVIKALPSRTCPVCATKWRDAFGPRWFEMEFHTTELDNHRKFTTGGRLGQRLRGTAVIEVPAEVWGIRGANQEVYLLIRDLRTTRGLGAKAIRKELLRINEARSAKGQAQPKVPSLQTIQYWLRRINGEIEREPRPEAHLMVAVQEDAA